MRSRPEIEVGVDDEDEDGDEDKAVKDSLAHGLSGSTDTIGGYESTLAAAMTTALTGKESDNPVADCTALTVVRSRSEISSIGHGGRRACVEA